MDGNEDPRPRWCVIARYYFIAIPSIDYSFEGIQIFTCGNFCRRWLVVVESLWANLILHQRHFRHKIFEYTERRSQEN